MKSTTCAAKANFKLSILLQRRTATGMSASHQPSSIALPAEVINVCDSQAGGLPPAAQASQLPTGQSPLVTSGSQQPAVSPGVGQLAPTEALQFIDKDSCSVEATLAGVRTRLDLVTRRTAMQQSLLSYSIPRLLHTSSTNPQNRMHKLVPGIQAAAAQRLVCGGCCMPACACALAVPCHGR